MTRCPKCGAENAIVNLCGCDPNNLPTRPVPDMQTVATTAMFLMEGMKDAKDRNKAQGSSRSLYLENHGYIETVSELAAYAEFSERLVLALPEQDCGWPGVYDYEVSSEFGDWWFTHTLENGEPPTTEEGQAEFKRRFDEFFAQGK